MKILLCHNSYQYFGGEDAVLNLEKKLLKSFGESVDVFEMNNSVIDSLSMRMMASINVSYSKRSKARLLSHLSSNNYDVVHVHNFFPLITASVFDACIEVGIPVIHTLHNYRLICPGALLMREEKVCELCVNSSPYKSVLHRCYKDSYLGTFFVANMVSRHRNVGTWNEKVSKFIALTEFAKKKFIQSGFPAGKILVKPNFVEIPSQGENSKVDKDEQALFVGRVSKEKGICVLLDAWKDINFNLLVLGDGPLLLEYKCLNRNERVSFKGAQTSDKVSDLMRKSRFLIMPSICFETFGMVIVEAFSHGLPVICSRLGAMEEIVEDGVTGLHFEAGNAGDLAEKVRWAETHLDEMRDMGENAKAVYKEKYTPEVNYKQLMAIYAQAIADNKPKNKLA